MHWGAIYCWFGAQGYRSVGLNSSSLPSKSIAFLSPNLKSHLQELAGIMVTCCTAFRWRRFLNLCSNILSCLSVALGYCFKSLHGILYNRHSWVVLSMALACWWWRDRESSYGLNPIFCLMIVFDSDWEQLYWTEMFSLSLFICLIIISYVLFCLSLNLFCSRHILVSSID